MPRKDRTEPTDQANFRLKVTTLDRMERYKERHPLRPTLTQIVEAAVIEWLDRNEPALPEPPRPAKR